MQTDEAPPRVAIEHYADGELCDGAIALEGIRCFPMLWPAKMIGVRIGSEVLYFDREELLEFAEELRKAAHDG